MHESFFNSKETLIILSEYKHTFTKASQVIVLHVPVSSITGSSNMLHIKLKFSLLAMCYVNSSLNDLWPPSSSYSSSWSSALLLLLLSSFVSLLFNGDAAKGVAVNGDEAVCLTCSNMAAILACGRLTIWPFGVITERKKINLSTYTIMFLNFWTDRSEQTV